MNIFVGNLSFDATEEDVKKLFEGFGQVVGAVIVKEKNGKKSRGFGFVEMAERNQGEAAISALNLKEFMGRPLNVSPERPKSELDDVPLKKKKLPEKIKVAPEEYYGQKDFGKDKWFSPVFRSAGGDKKRRSRRSYGQRDEQETKERPSTWRKTEERPRTRRKNADESKPAKRRSSRKPRINKLNWWRSLTAKLWTA
ncbi:MAG: RNA-binding protein [Candidatus Omnitrophica bacterium]|nr:RNA-binding protein [Candidatus Omnitrophota bacterium]